MPLNIKVSLNEMMLLEMIRSPWYQNVIKSIKQQELAGNKISIDIVNPNTLVKTYAKLDETPEQRDRRVKRELDELVKIEL